MKNKNVTYLLLAAVAAIWGIVIFRIVKGLSGEEESTGVSYSQHISISDSTEESYSLIAAYRDPFLGNTSGSVRQTSSTSINVTRRATKPVIQKPLVPVSPVQTPSIPAIDWSFIQYKGQISNKGGKAVGIISIRGNEHLVSPNTRVGDVQVITVTKDSIWVEYSGKKKGIWR